MTRPPGARWSSSGSVSATQARFVTERTSAHRFELFSSGLKRRKIPRIEVLLHHVAEEGAHDPRRLGVRRPRLRHLDGVVAEVGHPEIPEEEAAVGVRVGAHAACPVGGKRGQLRSESAGWRRRAPPACSSSEPALEDLHVSRASPSRRSAPGASATTPRSSCRRLPSARSTPWESAGRSSASAASPPRPSVRAALWMPLDLRDRASRAAAMSWCIASGSSPSTKEGS